MLIRLVKGLMNARLKTLLSISSPLALSLSAFGQLPSPSTGWNLGNTFEAIPSPGSWGPLPSQALINSVASAGFNTVRIPCSWMSNSDSNGNISSSFISQVQQTVNWCTAKGLYVIINDHWDNGWLDAGGYASYNPTLNSKMQYMWTQVATAFNGYDSHVLFAGANEPAASTAAQTGVLFQYYQTFVNAVRATGGNNATRWLIVQGPETNIDNTCSWVTTASMPTDSAHHLMIEVHLYDPFQFTQLTADASWGNMFYFWGSAYHSTTLPSRNATWGEESYVESEFSKMQTQFKNAGYPVLVGEYEASPKPSESDLTGANITLNYDSCTYWNKYVHDSANNHGLFCTVWNISGQVFNWTTGAVTDQTMLNAFLGKSAVPPPGSGNLINNGTYTIVGIQSGSALDDPGSSTANGTQMDIWTINGGNNQKWTLTNLGNNVVELVNVASGLALEVNGGSTTNGAKVDQWSYGGSTNQQWQVVQVSSGVYNLKNVNSGQMLDVVGAKKTNGTLIDQWPSNSGTNQQWKFQ